VGVHPQWVICKWDYGIKGDCSEKRKYQWGIISLLAAYKIFGTERTEKTV
jgi:hypothetical protein